MIEAADITVVPVTDEIARLGVAAFAAFGNGRGHPARLNLADCLSYAPAPRRMRRRFCSSALISPKPTLPAPCLKRDRAYSRHLAVHYRRHHIERADRSHALNARPPFPLS
jgi:hypothetical protein